MKNKITTIPHLEEIKEIRRLEQVVFKETDIPIYDLSHWNLDSRKRDEDTTSRIAANP